MKLRYAQNDDDGLWHWGVHNDDLETVASSGRGEITEARAEAAFKALVQHYATDCIGARLAARGLESYVLAEPVVKLKEKPEVALSLWDALSLWKDNHAISGPG